MASKVHLRGNECDWGTCEITIDGSPFPYGFDSIGYRLRRESEKIYVNGSPYAVSRTQGRLVSEASASMPYKHFVALREALGGSGTSGSDFMFKVFQVTLTYRPRGDSQIYIDVLEDTCLGENNISGSVGGSPMKVDTTLDVMKIIYKPPQ